MLMRAEQSTAAAAVTKGYRSEQQIETEQSQKGAVRHPAFPVDH